MLSVNRWTKYGKDRLYVADPVGESIGWLDLQSGATVLERPEWIREFDRAIAKWLLANGMSRPRPGASAFWGRGEHDITLLPPDLGAATSVPSPTELRPLRRRRTPADSEARLVQLLAALPADAVGRVFLETAGPEDVIDLPAPAGVQVNWVFRGGAADEVGDDRSGDNSPVIAAVRAAEWLPGQVHVFIHGEAQTVMHNLRPYIRRERGVPAAWAASISGYWRRGRTEESFKTWKRELAAAEGIDPA